MLDMFHEMVGDPEKDKQLFQQNSPVMNADKIKTPLFVAQGAKDPRVNINESNQIVDALKKRGIDLARRSRNQNGAAIVRGE
jgi:dipeptidyl aminopeptidase/acylaminoacyl peptidase